MDEDLAVTGLLDQLQADIDRGVERRQQPHTGQQGGQRQVQPHQVIDAQHRDSLADHGAQPQPHEYPQHLTGLEPKGILHLSQHVIVSLHPNEIQHPAAHRCDNAPQHRNKNLAVA